MPDDLQQILAQWDGELTVVRRMRSADAWLVVAVHSTALGPSAGGCRLRSYPSLADAVTDAHRLSSAMTAKFAVCDLPLGGGKSVLAMDGVPHGRERRGLFAEVGTVLADLRGLYSVAPDMNTSPADMDLVGEVTGYVFCRSREKGGSGSTAPATADGVYYGIGAALEWVFGSPDPSGRRIVVQGTGAVGARLAERLHRNGGDVVVSDIDDLRAHDLAARLGVASVPAGEALSTPCDVLAPCAVGGLLTEDTVAALRCLAIAGAANNQLAHPGVARRLDAAGILWTPDFVVNSGGVLHGAGLELLGWTVDEVEARLRDIAVTLLDVFDQAQAQHCTTLEIAEGTAQQRLLRAGHRAADPQGGAGALG